ncbi:hypothetical protein [Leptolyngbya ohadii]|uniref:hypothetical protein n=1 Tax=Leptolyngbya ohadii TaxID=1962290 RepID=UPI000B5A087E|nr:hypothetical protein [Leptolyngbya ohadii]
MNNSLFQKSFNVLCFGISTGILSSVLIALPAFSQTPPAISLPPNIAQLLDDFNLTPVPCAGGVATIQIGSGTVCVEPSDRFPAGDYVYDPDTDAIRRLHQQTNGTGTSQPGVQFAFRNVLEYSNCLEDILQFYKDSNRVMQQGRRSNCIIEFFEINADRGFSREQALQLIRAADAYATTSLSPPMYPPVGIRRRIAQEFGFIYSLDSNPR